MCCCWNCNCLWLKTCCSCCCRYCWRICNGPLLSIVVVDIVVDIGPSFSFLVISICSCMSLCRQRLRVSGTSKYHYILNVVRFRTVWAIFCILYGSAKCRQQPAVVGWHSGSLLRAFITICESLPVSAWGWDAGRLKSGLLSKGRRLCSQPLVPLVFRQWGMLSLGWWTRGIWKQYSGAGSAGGIKQTYVVFEYMLRVMFFYNF